MITIANKHKLVIRGVVILESSKLMCQKKLATLDRNKRHFAKIIESFDDNKKVGKKQSSGMVEITPTKAN